MCCWLSLRPMKIFRFLLSKTFAANVLLAAMVLIVGYFLLRWSLSSLTHHNETIEVPDLAGLHMDDAATVLKESGLEMEILDSSEFNNSYDGHEVWVQYPRAGAQVKAGRPIRLTVNPVREPLIALPSLIEKTRRRAIFDLKSKGFIVGDLSYVPYIGKDVVVKVLLGKKEVAAGTYFPKGTRFNLVLGGGLSEEKVRVPNLARLTMDEAIESLMANSLNLGLAIWELPPEATAADSLRAKVYKQVPGIDYALGLRMGAEVDIWLTTDSTKWPVDTLGLNSLDTAQVLIDNADE